MPILVATHLVLKERLSCSIRLVLFWTISNSPELGLTLVFFLQMERTTVDNSEHDYPRWRTTAPKTINMKCKKTVKQNRNPIRLRILPFYTIIFTTAFKSIQIVGWFSQNHRTANPAREPHSIWQSPLFSLPPSHRAPRASFFFLPSLPTTQRGLCGGESLGYERSWDPFLERPGNFSGPKSNIQIKI